jgi:hypothetical protein
MSVRREGLARSGAPPVLLAVPAGPWPVVLAISGTIAAVIGLWFLTDTLTEGMVEGEIVVASHLSRFGVAADPEKISNESFVVLSVPEKYGGAEIRRWRISVEMVNPVSGDISHVPARWFGSGALVDSGRGGARGSGNVLSRYVSFSVGNDGRGNPLHWPASQDGSLVMVRVQRTINLDF